MAQIFNLTGIELAADNVEQAKEAKQCLIGMIRSHGITAAQLIKLSQFAEENDDMFRTVISTLNQGGDLKSIAMPLLQKAMAGGLGKKTKKR